MNRRTFLKSAPLLVAAPISVVAHEAQAEEAIEPPFVVRMPDHITEQELEANRKWIAQQYTNASFKPIIIQGDVEITRLR